MSKQMGFNMLPGYLHFDVRHGLCADMLNASLAKFLPNLSSIEQTFAALGLSEIRFSIGETTANNVNGQVIHFYVNDRSIASTKIAPVPPKKNALKNLSPIWQRPALLNLYHDALARDVQDIPLIKSEFIHSCLNGEFIDLSSIKKLFLNKKIKPSIAALALQILENLECPLFNEQKLAGDDALWLVCHLVMLCAEIDILDPKFITASKIFIGEKWSNAENSSSSLHNKVWLDHVLSMLPIIETDQIVEVDVLAAAFMKTLVGKFGARGESTILKIGVGLKSSKTSNASSYIEALWCEANLADSMNECGPSNNARLSFVHEISGIISAATDMSQLSSMLSLEGAMSITWHLVYGEKNLTYNQVQFFASDHNKREIIEAFLVKGGAINVSTRAIERHELNRRLVSVPMGTGNKTSSVRFYEYIYYDKTVRVEPVKEDLDSYVEKTNYNVDVARSDLLLMWKKWRGRIASENS